MGKQCWYCKRLKKKGKNKREAFANLSKNKRKDVCCKGIASTVWGGVGCGAGRSRNFALEEGFLSYLHVSFLFKGRCIKVVGVM